MPLTRSQYEKIINGYDARRTEALAKRDMRLAKIREKIPEYAALEDESTEYAASFARRYIENPSLDLGELDNMLHDLLKKREALLIEHGYDPDYLSISYTCPDCQDTGYIDGRKCHCFIKREIDLLYNRSNIREMLKTENFANLREDIFGAEDLSHFRDAVSVCRKFIDHFDSEYSNLMLYGTVGTGKSFLSCCIAKELIDSGHSVIYLSAADFFKLYGDMMFRRRADNEEELLHDDDIFTSHLLVPDDLGTELSNQYTCSALFDFLNTRHTAGRSTIVNTNLSLQELHDRYSDRVFSRMTGYYTMIKLTGSDLRLKLRSIS